MGAFFNGIAVSSGIAIAKAKIIKDRIYNIIKQSSNSPDFELDRLEKALEKASGQLSEMVDECRHKLDEETLQIFETHFAMLNDHNLKKMINSKIQKGFTAEFSTRASIDELKAIFDMAESDYKKERAADFEDIGKRIINALFGYSEDEISDIKDECIIVAKDLTPSQTARMNLGFVKGFIAETGGQTSHSAIMARTYGIPAVVGIPEMTFVVQDGDTLVIDGERGKVFVNPDEETVSRYKILLDAYLYEKEQLKAFVGVQAKTLDGMKIDVECNIGTVKDLSAANEVGAEGIGLFRTEFLFMDKKSPPTEEEQFIAYRQAAQTMAGRPVVIRTLDIGGDKEIPYFQFEKEANPFLGNRAIRFCLERQDIFKTQLKAILRAAVYGNIKILFPMISGIVEFNMANMVLDEAKDELRKENVQFKDDIEVGVMIEIPSAAIISDLLAKKADFFSIGTNDLIQYTMAVDRTNDKVGGYYDPLNPAVLRLIKMVCKNAESCGIHTAMCGEMAGDLKLIPLVIGLGVEKLSMSAASVLKAKKYISKFSFSDAARLAQEVLEAGPNNIEQLLNTFYIERNS